MKHIPEIFKRGFTLAWTFTPLSSDQCDWLVPSVSALKSSWQDDWCHHVCQHQGCRAWKHSLLSPPHPPTPLSFTHTYTALRYDLWLNTAWKKTQMPVAKWCPPHTNGEHIYTTIFCLFEVTAVTSDEWFMEIFVFTVDVHVFTLEAPKQSQCVLPYSPIDVDESQNLILLLICKIPEHSDEESRKIHQWMITGSSWLLEPFPAVTGWRWSETHTTLTQC